MMDIPDPENREPVEPEVVSELPTRSRHSLSSLAWLILSGGVGWWLLDMGLDRLLPDSPSTGLLAVWLAMFVGIVAGADYLRDFHSNLPKFALWAWALGGIAGGAIHILYLPTGDASVKPATSTAASESLPDVIMYFRRPTEPGVVLENIGDVVAENIKWAVVVCNLSDPSVFKENGNIDFVPNPFESFDFLRAHRRTGMQPLFQGPGARAAIAPGNYLFGYSTVSCPKCAHDRVYWVFFEVGKSGWSAEVPGGMFDHRAFVQTLRQASKEADPSTWLLGFVPAEQRVPIPAP